MVDGCDGSTNDSYTVSQRWWMGVMGLLLYHSYTVSQRWWMGVMGPLTYHSYTVSQRWWMGVMGPLMIVTLFHRDGGWV